MSYIKWSTIWRDDIKFDLLAHFLIRAHLVMILPQLTLLMIFLLRHCGPGRPDGLHISPLVIIVHRPSHTTCLSEQVCWSDTGLLSHWPLDFNRIPETLLGWITAPNSTLPSLCVLQPWVRLFRGAPCMHRPRRVPSKGKDTSRGQNHHF